MPAVVAPKGLDADEAFVARSGPKLAGALEARLVLFAGGFQGPASAGFAPFFGFVIIHARRVVLEIVSRACIRGGLRGGWRHENGF